MREFGLWERLSRRLRAVRAGVLYLAALACVGTVAAQEYGPPDRGQPGDEMIQAYLSAQAVKLDGGFLLGMTNAAAWQALRPQYYEEYLYMLGLWPVPARTPLWPAVTGQLEGRDYAVEKLHFQSRPQLYVTANLYRPARIAKGERLPAIVYVCGHSGQGRNGCKTAYQAHGIWLARHGYICLMLDTLQLGEIAGMHHGTYRENRWSWHARGYTPAGVECWNGVRGVDYLLSRPDVDPERIGVTGISGGGAASFWIAAADERVKLAVPASGMADLESYVSHRVINGHCDCMFLCNTFAWPWTRIAGLIAPRPLLFVNSDQDSIFPMDANERVINRLKRLYSLFGASDRVDCLVSVGGHAYREDLRQGIFRFINTEFLRDPRPVLDTEVDLVTTVDGVAHFPLAGESLRVFPSDADLPKDERNTRVDEWFVPLARPGAPQAGQFDAWRTTLTRELRRVVFRAFPERIPAARVIGVADAGVLRLETEPGVELRLTAANDGASSSSPQRILLVVSDGEDAAGTLEEARRQAQAGDALCLLEPRGYGATRWTRKNPPNYIERAHVLLGTTVDTGRVRDVIAAARFLAQRQGGRAPVTVFGRQASGILAAYAALWEPDIAGAMLVNPPVSHLQAGAPQFLNILRVCDVPEMLGLLAPRRLSLTGADAAVVGKVKAVYEAAGAAAALETR